MTVAEARKRLQYAYQQKAAANARDAIQWQREVTRMQRVIDELTNGKVVSIARRTGLKFDAGALIPRPTVTPGDG